MLQCLQLGQADHWTSNLYGSMQSQDVRLTWSEEEASSLQHQQQQRWQQHAPQQHQHSRLNGDIDAFLGQVSSLPEGQGTVPRFLGSQQPQPSPMHFQAQQSMQQWDFPPQRPESHDITSLGANAAMQAQRHLGLSGEAAQQSRIATPTFVLSDSFLDADNFEETWIDPALQFETQPGRRSSELFPPRLQHSDSLSAPCSPAMRAGSMMSTASYSTAASPAASYTGLWDPGLLDPEIGGPAPSDFLTTGATGTAAARPAAPSAMAAALRARSASAGRTHRSSPDWMPEDMHEMGSQTTEGTPGSGGGGGGSWRCKHPGCGSTRVFVRACDLRKHYRAHTKSHFCTVDGCPRYYNGFSSEKDCRRHMRSHNPNIECPAEGCGRKFSRVDNMRKHHEAIHQRRQSSTASTRRRSAASRSQEGGTSEAGEDDNHVLESAT